MKAILLGLINRFKEPSSYAGLSLVLTNLGIQLPNGAGEALSYVLAGICALVSVFLAEKKV